MNTYGRTKEEFPGASSAMVRAEPMEGLNEAGPPPFLTKTYDIIEYSATDHIISWSGGNNSFIVWDSQAFSTNLLPRFFKHNKFSSFVRQLNTYGFRKVDSGRWEFVNERFVRGQRHLLKNIRRRKTHPRLPSLHASDACVEVGRFGVDGEIDTLRRDKQVLMVELVKFRQQQHNTRTCLQLMEERLRKTEMKQQQMMGFLGKAMQNPSFVQQLIQHKHRTKELDEAITKKRRQQIDQRSLGIEASGVLRAKTETQDHIIAEFDRFAMNLQGLSGNQNNIEEENKEKYGSNDRSLDEGFWDDLLNGEIDQEISAMDIEEEEENEDVLAGKKLGHYKFSS